MVFWINKNDGYFRSMTVKEAIDELSKYDKNMKVMMADVDADDIVDIALIESTDDRRFKDSGIPIVLVINKDVENIAKKGKFMLFKW